MTNCIFEPRTDTSSATICKHCGQEKFLHIQLPQQEISDEKTLSEKYQEYKNWLNEIPELSDEEIWKASIDYDNGATYETPIGHFIAGAKWYREHLKTK